MDKYAMISFIPSIAIVVFSVVFVGIGIWFVKKNIAADAEAAEKKG